MALTNAYSSICPHLIIADGATTGGTITISGMAVGDVIDSISHVSTKASIATETPVSVTSATIVAGGFTLDFNTSADQLRVFWIDTSA